MRAHSREVSTSSAAITQRGGFFASGEPGKIMNLAPAGAEELAGLGLAQADLAEQAGEHGDVDPVGVRGTSLSVIPALRAALRSWPCRSCHSRMRRKCRNSSRSSLRNRLPVSASRCSWTYSQSLRNARKSEPS